jgi:hypothetical protein
MDFLFIILLRPFFFASSCYATSSASSASSPNAIVTSMPPTNPLKSRFPTSFLDHHIMLMQLVFSLTDVLELRGNDALAMFASDWAGRGTVANDHFHIGTRCP